MQQAAQRHQHARFPACVVLALQQARRRVHAQDEVAAGEQGGLLGEQGCVCHQHCLWLARPVGMPRGPLRRRRAGLVAGQGAPRELLHAPRHLGLRQGRLVHVCG